MDDKILRLPDVINTTGLSRSTIYAYVKEGKFPSQLALGDKMVGWLASDVTRWIQTRHVKNEGVA